MPRVEHVLLIEPICPLLHGSGAPHVGAPRGAHVGWRLPHLIARNQVENRQACLFCTWRGVTPHSFQLKQSRARAPPPPAEDHPRAPCFVGPATGLHLWASGQVGGQSGRPHPTDPTDTQHRHGLRLCREELPPRACDAPSELEGREHQGCACRLLTHQPSPIRRCLPPAAVRTVNCVPPVLPLPLLPAPGSAPLLRQGAFGYSS
jgi:hypothetical protein